MALAATPRCGLWAWRDGLARGPLRAGPEGMKLFTGRREAVTNRASSSPEPFVAVAYEWLWTKLATALGRGRQQGRDG